MLTISQMTPYWGAADCTCEGRAVIQKDLDRLEEWGDRDLMKFSKEKGEVLPLGWSSPLHWYRPGTDWLGGSSAREDLGVLVNAGLNTSLSPEQSHRIPALSVSCPFRHNVLQSSRLKTCSVKSRCSCWTSLARVRWAHRWHFALLSVGVTDQPRWTGCDEAGDAFKAHCLNILGVSTWADNEDVASSS